MSPIGRMSGITEFDDNLALSDAGLSSLQDGQTTAFKRYWFQEASADQEQYMLIRKEIKEMDKQEWRTVREKMFGDADINNDGSLNYNEAVRFLKNVRPLDR